MSTALIKLDEIFQWLLIFKQKKAKHYLLLKK